MVALRSDVARSDENVRAAFESRFRTMVTVLGRALRNATQPPENAAMAMAIFVQAAWWCRVTE